MIPCFVKFDVLISNFIFEMTCTQFGNSDQWHKMDESVTNEINKIRCV